LRTSAKATIAGAKVVLREFGLLGFFTVVTILATYPAIHHAWFRTPYHVHDSFNDILVIHWDLWWMNEALVNLGTNPFTTSYLYYPHGADLFFTPFAPLFGLLSVPLQQCVPGPEGAIWSNTVLTLLTFVLSGYTMTRLLRALGFGWIPSILAAIPFAFAPFRFIHMARLHYLASFWLPVYAIFLIRYLDRGGYRPLLGTALVGVGCLLSDHHHFLFLLFIAGAWLIYRLVARVVSVRLLAVRGCRCAALQVLVLAPLFPLILPAFFGGDRLDLENRLHFEKQARGEPTGEHLLMAPDLKNLAYILLPQLYRVVDDPYRVSTPGDAPPSESGPVAKGAADRPYPPFNEPFPYIRIHEDIVPVKTGPHGFTSRSLWLTLFFLGFFLVGLAGRRWPGKWLWFGLAVTSFLIALGPTREIFGTPVPMPFRLFALVIPPLKISRYPACFILLGLVAVTPILAAGLQGAFRTRLLGIAVTAVAALLLLGVTWERLIGLNLRFEATRTPAAYERLANDPAVGALVEVPLRDVWLHRFSMYGQIVHRRPIAEGGVTRVGSASLRFLKSPGLMALLESPDQWTGSLAPEEIERSLRPFRTAGFRWVLVHRRFYGPEEEHKYERALAILRAHRPAREERFGDDYLFRFD